MAQLVKILGFPQRGRELRARPLHRLDGTVDAPAPGEHPGRFRRQPDGSYRALGAQNGDRLVLNADFSLDETLGQTGCQEARRTGSCASLVVRGSRIRGGNQLRAWSLPNCEQCAWRGAELLLCLEQTGPPAPFVDFGPVPLELR
jgi:hypothetical protein